jgi:hypothetical protein
VKALDPENKDVERELRALAKLQHASDQKQKAECFSKMFK